MEVMQEISSSARMISWLNAVFRGCSHFVPGRSMTAKPGKEKEVADRYREFKL